MNSSPHSQSAGIIEPLAWCALFAGTLFYWVLAVNTLPFPPDSWSYFELSQSVLQGDFYRHNGIRQFQVDSPYSISFPPLWPIVIAIGSSISGVGPAIMPTLSVAIFAAMILLLESAYRHLYRQSSVGLITGLGLLCLSPFLDELKWGGSLPLTLLLLSVASLFWLQEPRPRNAFALGLLAGMACLLRFDAAPAATAILLMYFLRGLFWHKSIHGEGWRNALVQSNYLVMSYLPGLVLAVSPHVIYSIEHFNTLWISDNTQVALSDEAGVFVTDFYQNWPRVELENNVDFLRKMATHAPSFWRTTFYNLLLPMGLVASIYVIFARPTVAATQGKAADRLLPRLLVLLVAWSASLVGLWLTGYDDRRYYLPEILLLLIATTIVFNSLQTKAKRNLIFLALLLLLNEIWTQFDKADFNSDQLLHSQELVRQEDNAEGYESCYELLGGEGKVMFIDDDITASRMAAMTAIDTTMMPRNLPTLRHADLKALLDSFDIRAFVLTAGNPEQWLPSFTRLGLQKEPCPDYAHFYFLQAPEK